MQPATSAVCSRIAYSDQKRPWCSYLLPGGEGAPQGRMRAELRALACKSPHPAVPARPRKRGSPRSPREKERRPRRTCNSTVKRANKSSFHTGISMFLYMLLRRARLSLLWIPIRVPSVFHPWLKDLLLRYFQRRVFNRWRRNKPEPAFRISSPSPRLGCSRLSFKSGTYCRPVP
jgi:hypothetical protein